MVLARSQYRARVAPRRDFWLLWFGQGASSLGSAISDIAYPLLVLGAGGSPFEAGLLGLASTGSRLLLRLVAGLVVDMLPRRALLLWCDAGRALVVGSLAITLLSGIDSFALVLAVLFIEGGLSVVFFAAERAVLRTLVPRDQLTGAIAKNQIYFQFATLAGPPLGGITFAIAHTLPFIVDAISYVASALLIIAIKADLGQAGERGKVSVNDVFSGWRWIWLDRPGRASLLHLGGINALLAGLPLVVILNARAAGSSGPVIGTLFAAGGIGGIAGALLLPWLRGRWSDWAIVTVASWIWPIMLVTTSVDYAAWRTAVMLFLLSTTIAPMQSIVFGYQTAHAPQELQGRVHAAVNLVSNGLTPLAPVAVGYLAERWGVASPGTALVVMATFIALYASVSRPMRELCLTPIEPR